jgi:membrane protease YdiL (CAAX protease family)
VTSQPAPLFDGDSRSGDLSPPAHRWRSRDLLFFAAMFIVAIVVAAILQAVAGFFALGGTAELILIICLTILVEGSLVACTVFLVRDVYKLSYRTEMGLTRNYRIQNRSLVVLGAGLAGAVILVSAVVSTWFPGLLPESETALEQILATRAQVILFAIFGVTVAPALEELLFRGFLFRVLSDVVGVSVAIWTTAAIFAVFHGPQLWPNWPAIGVILGVGYVLSRMREHTRSIVPGFIVHTVYNAVLFLMFAFATLVGASGGE